MNPDRKSTLFNWLQNLSIAKKLYFISGIMAFLILFELLALWFSIKTISSIRAYVGGEGLWSKAQKDAIFHLNRYGTFRLEKDYYLFKEFMKVPLGDNKARLELEKENPNYEIAREGFLEGLNHPDDIDGLMNTYRRFRKIYYIDKAISIWSEADPIIQMLIPIGDQLKEEITKKNPSEEKIKILLAQIDPINEQLTILENEFSKVLGEGSRWIENLLLWVLLVIAVLVECVGLLLTYKVSKGISIGIKEIVRVSEKIADSDFSERAKIFSKDEIGELAKSFNQMTENLEETINHRIQAEEILREKSEQLMDAQNIAQIGSWSLDLNNNKIEISEELFRIYGIIPEDFKGTIEDSIQYIDATDRENVINVINYSIQKQESFEFFMKINSPNGEQKIVSAKGKMVEDKSNKIRKVTGTVQDVTKIKKVEIELLKSKYKAEEDSRDLLFKNKQLFDFCNIVSHNLRAPLVNISLLVEFLETTDASKEQIELISKINPQIEILSDVLNELVESIQIRNRIEINLVQINLKEFIEKTVTEFTEVHSFNKAIITIELEKKLILNSSKKYLKRILFNLMENSIKFKSPHREPVIKIKVKENNNSIIISIEDNGMGIDLDLHKNRIFKIKQVFHPNLDSKGFGLFLTKTQVEALGGSITVESKVDIGTIFQIEFKTNQS